MDFFDLLFGGGEAIQSIFQLGFIPKEEDFREFSSVEYQQFNEKECDICGKMYTFNSDLPVSGNDIYAFSEKEKEFMLKGAEIIDNLCEKKTFISDDVNFDMLPPYCLACSLKGQNMLVMKNNLCKNKKRVCHGFMSHPF
ncbi:hypothetical protein [Segatella sp.]|uniref:hypothetical protein n=1 Tax=Segatella sp. TaxID=2974253 RepID=UPI003AAAC159